MSDKLPHHIANLKEFLCSTTTTERDEDLAIGYFRKLYKNSFIRQSEAKHADGYVPGHFVLEIKSDEKDWYVGLLQGLAYQNKDLSFSLIVVACKKFLGIWRVDDLPQKIRDDVSVLKKKAPSAIGRELATKYKRIKGSILSSAIWYKPELTGPVFSQHFADNIKSFQTTLNREKKTRQPITLENFVNKLEEMKKFFDPKQPIKTVRAFYSMIYGPWDECSKMNLNARFGDRATLGGAAVTFIIPQKRDALKNFVDKHYVKLDDHEDLDQFFSRFDEAIDRVDAGFRRRNGIFFTDLDLSRLALWFVKKNIPSLGKNYLVLDPACGSGNLVTNWRSPLELRHKVVSELEPELLYAVEQRMKGDQWHNGKFTVVPKVEENMGLNFIDKSALEYLEILKYHLKDKGIKPDKPIAFLCNPPYRSDDDQAATSISYPIHPSIQNLTGMDAISERYCAFLAQMKLICQQAKDSGFPEDSVLLLFTESSWLTKRPVFQSIRREMLSVFQDAGGFIVNSKQFFDVSGSFPVVFSIWFYKGKDAGLDPERVIPLTDLAWLKRAQLKALPWHDLDGLDNDCDKIFKDKLASSVFLGLDHQRISEWCGQKRFDFVRSRRKDEIGRVDVGGLPEGHRCSANKKAYGESDGTVIGFMDDLTPCRLRKGENGIPWFRLNHQFMELKRSRLFSGPTDNRAYCASNIEQAKKTFVWYGLARTFKHCGYPIWCHNSEIWPVEGSLKQLDLVLHYCLAISYAENECVSIIFPGGNPATNSIEVRVENPMTPLVTSSFWCQTLKPMLDAIVGSTTAEDLVAAVDDVFQIWKREFRAPRKEITVSFEKPYLVSSHKLFLDSGLTQIRDFALATDHIELRSALTRVADLLKKTKEEFHNYLVSKSHVNYFGVHDKQQITSSTVKEFTPVTKFDKVLEKRLALAGVLVNESQSDKNFGRTKLAKLFYLADTSLNLCLETQYSRAAAGPLDQRSLYNQQVGVEPLAQRHGYFQTVTKDRMVRYVPSDNLDKLVLRASNLLGDKLPKINRLIKLFAPMTTQQAEIVATLYACWKDLLIQDRIISDQNIIKEFLKTWHPKKTQFDKDRLKKALDWMRKNKLVPNSSGKHTVAQTDDYIDRS